MCDFRLDPDHVMLRIQSERDWRIYNYYTVEPSGDAFLTDMSTYVKMDYSRATNKGLDSMGLAC